MALDISKTKSGGQILQIGVWATAREDVPPIFRPGDDKGKSSWTSRRCTTIGRKPQHAQAPYEKARDTPRRGKTKKDLAPMGEEYSVDIEIWLDFGLIRA